MNVGEMLARARTDANISQSELAKLMKVDRTTVQRWENNETKIKLETAIEGFRVLSVPMYPYLMSMLYTDDIARINSTSDIADVKKELLNSINELDDFHIRELAFILAGKHGSSPTGSLDMMTAHLHLPLLTRTCVAENIMANYELCEAVGALVNDNYIKPKTSTLKICTAAARNAVIDGKENYSI